ncbi:cell envelope integrity protein TolA [Pseudofulvimonas gallinarii]|uniref:Cell division and transport-associated protein TolA n=1 Tax=Pseudofulvimonas gallinarii TaxID=634155 RepID=A0A4S3KUF6_9GAMM|nr:cell envelope integrity protein TolA [Pseudofulvimonas gallinarii]TCT00783.1 cell division and transport-associated protein TolA [Pseudofulvimonas gallinarii]THD12819.1 protein TolA [Pseudofulvimonas gallinarii]
METTADKVKAVIYAVLVHALCIALALGGMFWWQTGQVVRAAGSPIEAVFVDLGALRPAPPRPTPARTEPARPRPQPPQPPATDQSARDNVEQQRIDRDAQLRAEQEAREQEEKRRRAEQVLLEEEQKRREEEQKRREEQQRREREAAEKAEREAREAAEREAAAQAQREAEQAQAGSGGQDDSLLAQYGAAITRRVHEQWREPDNTGNIVCTLHIVQVRGGRVLNVSVTNPCNADPAQRRRLENAALNAQPLPFQGFESVFRSDLIITFCHPKELPECTSQ